jgi:hypothetical protein
LLDEFCARHVTLHIAHYDILMHRGFDLIVQAKGNSEDIADLKGQAFDKKAKPTNGKGCDHDWRRALTSALEKQLALEPYRLAWETAAIYGQFENIVTGTFGSQRVV